MAEDTERKLSSLAIDRSVRTRSGWLRPFLWLVVIALVGGVGGLGIWRFVLDSPLEVRVAVARMPDAGDAAEAVLNGSGYVVARRKATVSSKTSGKVVRVLIEEGMRVNEGQILAQLDNSYQVAQRNLAQSQLVELRASLAEIDIQIEKAASSHRRVAALAEKRFASEDAVESARLLLDQLNAQKRRIEKSIVVAQKQLAVQEQLLDDTNIRAPFSGVVIAKAAQPGETISPVSGGGGFTRTGICTIVDMDSLEVEVDVSEAYINRVRQGQQATVEPAAFPDTRLPAEVIAIIPTADRAKETVRVRVGFTAKDERILPDMGVKVSFLEQGAKAQVLKVPEGVIVPASAVGSDDGQAIVWLVKQNVLARVPVALAESDQVTARLVSGVRVGDAVVVEIESIPSRSLKEGTTVVIAR